MNIYIAAAFESLERLLPIRYVIQQTTSHKVVSTWLDEKPGISKEGNSQYILNQGKKCKYYATRDVDELSNSDLVILDTFDLNERGGREFEVGFAYGLNVPIWRIGPPRNVFHYLPEIGKFKDWSTALELLKSVEYAKAKSVR